MFAIKPLRKTGDIGQRCLTALAIREHGTSQFSKDLRFMYAVPREVASEFSKLIAVPKPNTCLVATLSSGSHDAIMTTLQAIFALPCVPVTMGQRCADWSVMRHFRLSATNAGLILSRRNSFRLAVGLSVDTDRQEFSPAQWFTKFYESCFSRKVRRRR